MCRISSSSYCFTWHMRNVVNEYKVISKIPRNLLSKASLDLLLEPPDNRNHASLVGDESETEWVRVVESWWPRGHDTPVDGVVFEGDEFEGVFTGDLGESLELLFD